MKKARQGLGDVTAVVAAQEAVKSYSPAALGEVQKKGECVQCQKMRFEVLELVCAVVKFSPAQRNVGDFKQNWATAVAETNTENWTNLFVEIIQRVIEQFECGKAITLSELMHDETMRVLDSIPSLRVLVER